MRVLWICNIAIPSLATQLDLPVSNKEGWLTGLLDKISLKPIGDRFSLGVAFPVDGNGLVINRELTLSEHCRVKTYGFGEDTDKPYLYNPSLEDTLRQIIEDCKPDILHIFGTEFPHTLAAVRAFGKPERTLVGVQGLCSRIAQSYAADIPISVKYGMTLRDLIRRDNVWKQIDKFRKRGMNETEALKLTGHIAGRTDFDRGATGEINPGAVYHKLEETMRTPFYQGSWKLEACIPYSIFISQGDYPLKGFHYVLRAMPGILQKYPDAVLYVAGANILSEETWKDRLKRSAYAKYLRKLIKQNSLQEHVVMLGKLNAEEMKERYLASHVFVCPSALENSPNSLGEAMLLGVPCVAANVGGIPSMMVNGQDGILYTPGDIRGLCDAVTEIFEKEEITKLYSRNAKHHAYETHDSDNNYSELMRTYYDMTVFAETEQV